MSTATPKKEYYSGHDIKSLCLNLASSLLFLWPFVAYFYTEYLTPFSLALAVSFLLAFVAPPMGWKRPHPYSDMPENRLPKKD